MIRQYDQKQMYLFPPSMENFIGEDHPAHMINELVDKLNLSQLEKRYGAMGQPAYHPRMILKVMFYGYSVGMFTTRKWQRGCEENLAFKFLSGMQQPSYKTFTEFRRRHQQDMEEIFYQTVKLAREMGIVKFANIALDGTKIEANTSKQKAMSYGRMKKEERRLKEEIKELLKKTEQEEAEEDQEYGDDDDGYHLKEELARREERLKKIAQAKAALEAREKKDHPGEPIGDKKMVSFADPEARCFTKKWQGTRYVYNPQAGVDMDSQLIVENHVEDSTTDAAAVEPAVRGMDENLEEKPEKMVIDCGYATEKNGEACQAHKVTPVCATSRGDGLASSTKKKEEDKGINVFSYDRDVDRFECPHGMVFEFHGEVGKKERRKRVYRSVVGVSCLCGQVSSKTLISKLYVETSHLVKREFDWHMRQPGNAELYRRRKCTVEPVMGQIKWGLGFRRFFCRGIRKVSGEWNMVCAALNIKKMGILVVKKREEVPASPMWRNFVHFVRLLVHWVTRINVHMVPIGHCV